MAKWFYAIDGEQFGPVEGAELKRAILDEMLGPNDLVWREGMPEWQPAGKVIDFESLKGSTAARKVPTPARREPKPRSRDLDDNPYAGYGDDDDDDEPQRSSRPAGFWLRFCANLIDSFILGIVASIGFFIFGFALVAFAAANNIDVNDIESANDEDKLKFGMFTIFAFIVYIASCWLFDLLYRTILEGTGARGTLGKLALGIEVVDRDGRTLSLLHSLGRNLARWLSGLTLGIGFLMVALTADKQGLHDLIASTYVRVKRPRF